MQEDSCNKRVFISYTRSDEAVARRLYAELESQNLSPWLDVESILPGQDWKSEIQKAIKKADFVVLLLSTKAVAKRGYFQKEIRIALDVLREIPFGQIYLLPARIDDCDVPEPLSPIQRVDLFPNFILGFERLLKAISVQSVLQKESKKKRIIQPTTKFKEILLLVNDEPATMNSIVDHWRSNGIRVEYAFDVREAIIAIQRLKPTVVVSDMSHFMHGQQQTDQAAFEILMWSIRKNVQINVIVTCAELTETRKEEALQLGAVGICNNIIDLYRFLNSVFAEPIENPFANGVAFIKQNYVDSHIDSIPTPFSSRIYISCLIFDYPLAKQIAAYLRNNGLNAFYEFPYYKPTFWGNPLRDVLQSFNFMLVLLSANSTSSRLLEYEIDAGIGKEIGKETVFVIPIIVDDGGADNVPFILHNRTCVDLRKGFDSEMARLCEYLNQLAVPGNSSNI